MKKTLDMLVKCGIPVHFPGNIGSEDGKDNFYIVKLRTPQVDSSAGVVYKTTTHVFTEKELRRSTLRFASDGDISAGSSNTRTLLGYVGTRTYVNKNSVLTTRFIIRFDGKNIPNLRGEQIGLFTARELKRSQDRMRWFMNNQVSMITRLRRWLHV